MEQGYDEEDEVRVYELKRMYIKFNSNLFYNSHLIISFHYLIIIEVSAFT